VEILLGARTGLSDAFWLDDEKKQTYAHGAFLCNADLLSSEDLARVKSVVEQDIRASDNFRGTEWQRFASHIESIVHTSTDTP